MGDAAASSRAVTGRRSTFARRGGGGKAGDGVPVDSEMTRVRPGDDAMNRGRREDAGCVFATRCCDGKGRRRVPVVSGTTWVRPGGDAVPLKADGGRPDTPSRAVVRVERARSGTPAVSGTTRIRPGRPRKRPAAAGDAVASLRASGDAGQPARGRKGVARGGAKGVCGQWGVMWGRAYLEASPPAPPGIPCSSRRPFALTLRVTGVWVVSACFPCVTDGGQHWVWQWAALATRGRGVSGGHGGGTKERGATSFDLMRRRSNLHARDVEIYRD